MRASILVVSLACVGCFRSSSGSNSERHTFEGHFRQVVANSRHTCLLHSGDGSVRCFGGDDTRNPPMTPIPAGAKFDRLVSARRTVCGIRWDNGHEITCFGACVSPLACQPPPGGFYDLALHDDRGGCAWGSADGQCWGDEGFLRSIAPPPSLLDKPIKAMVFGTDWSLIHYGNGTIAPYSGGKPSDERGVWNDPLLVDLAESGERVAGIAGKGATACVIDAAGTPRCVAYYGGHAPPPAKHVIELGFSAPMGTMPACVLSADAPGGESGTVTCTANVLNQVLKLPGSQYKQIAVGDHHICGLGPSGVVECIGSDRNGAVTGRNPWP